MSIFFIRSIACIARGTSPGRRRGINAGSTVGTTCREASRIFEFQKIAV